MPLHAFTIDNYRSFVEPVRLELRPLTLLFGYNNAGKSALARVLPLLRDSVAGPSSTPLNLASPAVRGGSFADLRSRLTGVRALRLGLEWEEPRPFRFYLILQDLPEQRRHVVRNFMITAGDTLLLRGEWKLPEGGGATFGTSTYQLVGSSGAPEYESMLWRGLSPSANEARSGGEIGKAMEEVESYLRQLESTEWIGAIRRPPDRIRLMPDSPPLMLDHEGGGAADMLAWDAATGGTLLKQIADWYQSHAGATLGIKPEGRSYSLVMGREEVNLLDAGEGLAQVLPVLVAAAVARERAARGFHLVLEQPELHLHPAAHAPLAAWLCDIAREEPAPRMVIETHSENFLFGVQLAVARRELSPERVGIYWVRREEGRSVASPITMDEWGRLKGWPRDVFTEETKLAEQLLEARRQWGYQ